MDKIKRINELIEIINRANIEYYQENKPSMTNKEYDELYDELVFLENETKFISKNSPTQNVGSVVVGPLKKKNHIFQMLSLNKTKSQDDLVSFLGEKDGILSWKLDGLTVALTYDNGILVEALTRGNGVVGEVITQNAKTFKNLPLEIDFKERLTVRGEAVITYTSFNKINDKKLIEEIQNKIVRSINSINSKSTKSYINRLIGIKDSNRFSEILEDIILNETETMFSDDQNFDMSEITFKNPRNLCSGAVRQLDPNITAKRDVEFHAFNLVEAAGLDFQNSHIAELKFLQDLGFSVVEYYKVDGSTVKNFVDKFTDKVKTFNIPADGLVLQLDDITYGRSLGSTAKFPLDAIAFKWSDETKRTKLIDVVWNTSRTGLINPIAVFDPIEIEGTTVRRASLHNLGIFENLKLGLGDEISVYKANMIIPQVEKNYTESNTLKHPSLCPTCSCETKIRENSSTRELICPNEYCPAKISKFLEHFISKNGMNISGLGVSKLNLFIETGFIDDFTDIFNLKNKRDDIIKELELEIPINKRKDLNKEHKMGIKMLDNILEAIDKASTTDLVNVLASLNIANIGKNVAKLLVMRYKNNIDEIINSTPEELSMIDGVGDVMAFEIHNYFSKDQNVKQLKTLIGQLKLNDIQIEENSVISGKKFVITGKLEGYKDRSELKQLLESMGAKVNSDVSSSTDFLINNDINSSSSKNKKAKEFGIKIITEKEVNKLIGNEKNSS